jgi:hypothetical protein
MPERLTRTTDSAPSSRRLRFELIFASVWLAIGLFLIPALIFWVGITLLGPYGETPGAGMGSFYADFYGDLASGEVRTWFIALGPLLLISLLRAVFIGLRSKDESAESATPERPRPQPQIQPKKTHEPRRVEPRIGD